VSFTGSCAEKCASATVYVVRSFCSWFVPCPSKLFVYHTQIASYLLSLSVSRRNPQRLSRGGAKKWQERLTVRLVYPDSHLKLECWNKWQYWPRGCRFKSQPFSFQVTMSCKMFVNKKYNLVAVMGQWCHAAGKVIIGHCVLCVSQTSVVYPPIRARGLRKGDEHLPTLLVCVTLYLAFFEVAG